MFVANTYALRLVTDGVSVLKDVIEVVEMEANCRPLRCDKPGAKLGMWLPFSALGRARVAYSKSPMRERLTANAKRSPGTLSM